jgi:hypothetical protein
MYLTELSFVDQSTRIPHVFPELGAVVANTPIVEFTESLSSLVSQVSSLQSPIPRKFASLPIVCSAKLEDHVNE